MHRAVVNDFWSFCIFIPELYIKKEDKKEFIILIVINVFFLSRSNENWLLLNVYEKSKWYIYINNTIIKEGIF